MNIIIIASIGKNNELGFNGKLIWRLKKDMKFFKETTLNHNIIMGRRTYESLPKILPNRQHIVITHTKINNPNVLTFSSFNEAMEYIKSLNEDVYVIGGEAVYKDFLDYANILYITKIDKTSEATSFFPTINENLYDIKILSEDEEDGISYKFVKYVKRGAK